MSYYKVRWLPNEKRLGKVKNKSVRHLIFALVWQEYFHALLNRRYIRLYRKLYGDEYIYPVRHVKILEDLEKDGIASAPVSELFEGEVLKNIQSEWAQIRQSKRDNQVRFGEGSHIEVDPIDVLNEYPMLSKVIFNKGLIDIVAGYMGQIPRFAVAFFQRNIPPVDRKVWETTATSFHRDSDDLKVVKVIIYLDTVDESNGPFEYIRESHRKGFFRDIAPVVANKTPSSSQPLGRLNSLVSALGGGVAERHTRITGDAGTTVFVDTSGIHRGGRCLSRERAALFLMYTSASAFVSGDGYKIRRPCEHAADPLYRRVFGIG